MPASDTPVQADRRAGRRAHHNLFYEISTERAGNERYDRTHGGWADALGEIDEPGAAIGLISSEAFQYCTPDDVQRVAELLAGREVTVVVYLRRHHRWLESARNQRARFGRVDLSSREFVAEDGRSLGDHARTLMPWIDDFGDQSADVRIFDRVDSDLGVVGDFVNSYLKQLLAVATVVRDCRNMLGAQFSLASQSAMRISSFFRDRDIFDYTACSFDEALEIDQYFAASNEQLAFASTSFRSTGQFDSPTLDDFAHFVELASLDEGLFDDEERRLVERLATHVSNHVEETTS